MPPATEKATQHHRHWSLNGGNTTIFVLEMNENDGKEPAVSHDFTTLADICYKLIPEVIAMYRITFIIKLLLLLTRDALNNQRGEENMYSDNFCYVVKPGVFSGGLLTSLASVALAIVYYVVLSLSKSTQTWGPQQNQGIAMGQPVIPPQSNEPVFVHKDNYNRCLPSEQIAQTRATMQHQCMSYICYGLHHPIGKHT